MSSFTTNSSGNWSTTEASPTTSNKVITIPTSGTYCDRDIVITISKPTTASLNNAATSGVSYTSNTADATVIPANGSLYINAGYIGNTVITLGHMIPDDSNYTNAGTDQIRSGYEAYDTNGNKLIGTIADVSPSFDGGTLSKGTASGGGLSGGGLTASAGEVATVTQGVVTPSVGGTSITNASTYGITSTKPSGTDGTNYLTFDPDASVTTDNTVHGRGSVTRAAVTRAAFSQPVTRAAVLYNGAATGYINKADNTTALAADTTGVTVSLDADSTTIGSTSSTSNWSTTTNSNPSIAAGTNYYVPIVAASATAGTASASASIAKEPSASTTASSASASAKQTGMDDGISTSATSYYFTSSASATSGSASAASGYSTANASATGGSASVSKGITSGSSATGSSSGTKSATSTEVIASSAAKTASDSSTVYLKAATVTLSDDSLNVTPSVTPTATASASSNASLGSVTTTAPTSGYYITVVGGNSKTSGSSTSGESCTVTKTAGYLAAGTASVASTATATANANSKTVYYPINTTSLTNYETIEKTGDSSSLYNSPDSYIKTSASGSPQLKLTGYGSGTTGRILSSNGSAAIKYIDYFEGTYTVS